MDRTMNASLKLRPEGDSSISYFLIVLLISICSGCQDGSLPSFRSWHTKHRWVATEYFTDPLMIEACAAIESDDLAMIKEILRRDVDINKVGLKGVTLLLWALPNKDPAIFELLLANGADPNIRSEVKIGKGEPDTLDATVTLVAARFGSITQFRSVLEHGGDPNTVQEYLSRSLLHVLITHAGVPDRLAKIDVLLSFNPDLNVASGTYDTPMMAAVGRNNYNVALKILDAGGDPDIYKQRSNQKLIHYVVRNKGMRLSPNPSDSLDELMARLEENGDSAEAAEQDLARWLQWSKSLTIKKASKLIQAEVQERIRRERDAK